MKILTNAVATIATLILVTLIFLVGCGDLEPARSSGTKTTTPPIVEEVRIENVVMVTCRYNARYSGYTYKYSYLENGSIKTERFGVRKEPNAFYVFKETKQPRIVCDVPEEKSGYITYKVRDYGWGRIRVDCDSVEFHIRSLDEYHVR